MTAADSPEAKGAKPINLALQGGGALGAFTWGVLDRLLEDTVDIRRLFQGDGYEQEPKG